MGQIGFVFIVLGFLTSFFLFALSVYSISQGRGKKFVLSYGFLGSVLLLTFLSLASLALLQAIVSHDFSLSYVAEYTSTNLPTFYLVTAFWAGQEGSLLFWAWLISLFLLIFFLIYRRQTLFPYAFSFVLGVLTFFFLLLTLPANPFKPLVDPVTGRPFSLSEGFGLNPLLQNFGMVFHPPTIFLGFAAFTFPLAWGIASLFLPRVDDSWVRVARRWTLLGWFFLGIGNVIGAWWAYVELGWGGYWAWDPVENASLLPWLTGTALLHSLSVYEKRKSLKVWTYFLLAATFLLCIFGTFLTRSGVVSSVHSFGASPVGSYFLVFLFLAIVFCFFLIYRRYKELVGLPLDSYLSREGSFALTNWLFIAFTVMVLWGTILPIFTGLFTGEQKLVQRVFFDRLSLPLIYGLVALLGFCFYLRWERFDWLALKERIFVPLALGVLIALPFFFIFPPGMVDWKGTLLGWFSFVLGGFSLASTFYRLYLDYSARSSFGGFLSYVFRDRRRYGGLIAHLGVLIMFFGIIASNVYKAETQRRVKPGETFKLRDVEVKYLKPVEKHHQNFDSLEALCEVRLNGKLAGKLSPGLGFYPLPKNPETGGPTVTAEVDILEGFWRDIYLALTEVKPDDTAVLVLTVEPLINWLWAGSVILFLGVAFAWWPEREDVEKSGRSTKTGQRVRKKKSSKRS